MTRWTAGERMTAYGSSADMALSWGRFGAQAAVVQICGTKPRDGSERKRFRSGTSGRDNNARNCCDVTHRRVLAPDETRPTSTPIIHLPSGYDWGSGSKSDDLWWPSASKSAPAGRLAGLAGSGQPPLRYW